MTEKEYIIFCDESDKDGSFFSDFYGGLIVRASQYKSISDDLNQAAQDLYITDEIKWNKVSQYNLERYKSFLQHIFRHMNKGDIKIRVMFMQKANVPLNISKEFKKNRYYKLYYQFIKHGLRLSQVPSGDTNPVNIRLYIDELAYGQKAQIEEFRNFIHRLELDEIFRPKGKKET